MESVYLILLRIHSLNASPPPARFGTWYGTISTVRRAARNINWDCKVVCVKGQKLEEIAFVYDLQNRSKAGFQLKMASSTFRNKPYRINFERVTTWWETIR
jgi:hypothetical protein